MSEKAELAKAKPERAETVRTIQMYGSYEEIQALGELVKKFAPWAQKLDNDEIGGVVRRVMSMGLDPLNGHEVQIWKDRRNVIQVMPAYTLMVDWVKGFKGDHTQPIYTRLGEDDLIDQGLPVDAVAYRCTFIMNEDLNRMTTMLEAGFGEPAEIRRMFEVSGLGVALREEYDAKSKTGVEYFAPTGRSKSWKVEKRALVDAYRHKFGTPSRSDIENLRRQSGTDTIQPEDWAQALEVGADERGTLELAKDSARRRDTPAITKEEATDGANALYGSDERATVDGVFKDVEEPEPPPEDESPPDPQAPEIPKDHWTRKKTSVVHFWAWCGKEGLDDETVLGTLNVKAITDYPLSLGEAKSILKGL